MKTKVKSKEMAAKKTGSKITTNKQDVYELAESQILLSTLIDSTNDFIWSVDSRNFGLLTWNKALQEYFYLTRNIIIKVGDRPEELFSTKEYVQIWRNFYKKALKTGNYSGEYGTLSETNVLLLNINPLLQDGKVFGLSVFGKNITSQKKAEESLRKTRDYWQSLIENISDLVTVLDKDGAIQFQNPASEKILGFKPEALVGKNVAELIHPDDWPQCEIAFASYDRTPLSKPPIVEFRVKHKNGSWQTMETTGMVKLDENGQEVAILTSRDITGRKLTEDNLKESELRFRTLSENSIAGIGIIQDNKMIYVNPAMAEIFGYRPAELIGASPLIYVHPDDQALVTKSIQSRISGETKSAHYEFRGLCKNGEGRSIEVLGVGIEINGKPATFSNILDITDRKRIQEELKNNEEKFRLAFMTGLDAYYWATLEEGRILEINPVFEEVFGYARHEVIGKTSLELNLYSDSEDRARMVSELKAKGFVKDLELNGRKKNGQIITVSISVSVTQLNSQKYILGVIRDITERKQIEESLRESETLFRSIFEQAAVGITQTKIDGTYIQVNSQFCKITGYTSEDFKNITYREITHPNDLALDNQFFDEMINGKRDKYSIEKRYIRKKGAVIWVDLSVSLVRNNKGDPLYTIGIIQEITERKQAAERLHIREERYRSLVDTQNSLISRADLNGNFTFVNDAYCKAFGKTREELIGHSFLLNVLPEDREMALKAHNQLYDPPHRYTVEDRSMTTAGLRWLRWEGSVVRDNNGNIIELQGVGTDITEQKQNEIQLQDYLGKLRNTVEGTIETIALIVEARDPYTSGHQKRVADISVKIAQELGLPEEQIRGIYMAGIIHDVGKIQVPAEILSKPGKLSKLEFDLIKTHPKVGFDLLKGIEFPWPIAQVIYQHHERVDGSGYPRKLKGERILLEAKIIGIADVIEAITSHRPYRAALGMDVALGEIKKNKGTLYDKEIAESFLKVIRKGYRFEKT